MADLIDTLNDRFMAAIKKWPASNEHPIEELDADERVTAQSVIDEVKTICLEAEDAGRINEINPSIIMQVAIFDARLNGRELLTVQVVNRALH